MKEIRISRNLLETMIYRYSDLEDPIDNLKYYNYIKDETKNCIYYMESEDDMDFYRLESIKGAYYQVEDIFNDINDLFHETANEVECYLYGIFGENAKTFNIYNSYIKGRENYVRIKAFWLVLKEYK